MAEYSLETKAQVLADWALGMPKAAIARKHNVPRTTVHDWCAAEASPLPSLTDMSQREELGRLLHEYLVSSLKALIAQNELAADRAYLEREDVSFAAVYRAVHSGFMDVAQAVEAGGEGELPLVASGVGAEG